MTVADLEAMAEKLKEAKREISAQLLAVEAELCAVLSAIDGARNAPSTKTH